MTPKKIQEALSLGENQHMEFKANTRNANALGQIVCGFLNASGGYLICGIQNPGRITGIEASPQEIANLEKKLHEGISPRAFVSFQIEKLDGRPVLVIEVPQGKDVPYAFRDIIYLREGDTTRKADAETIRDIVLRHQVKPERWERRFSLADLDTDVDPGEIKAAIADSRKMRRGFFRDTTDPFMVLVDFSAAKYGRLTNGGDVLFTRNPASRLPQTRIRAVCFSTDQTGDKFSDLKTFEGPLHRIFEEAYTFVVRNTPTIARFIKGNPKRQESPLYPEDAVREALINALVHRDYSATSGGVSVHIFPRRMEIWNTGPLPEDVTVENLQKGQQLSVLRNPDIAHVIYLRGLMEKAGRGGRLMAQLCKDAGLPPPVWKADSSGVTLTFNATDATIEAAIEPTSEVKNSDSVGFQYISKKTKKLTPEATPEVTREATREATREVTPEVQRLVKRINDEMPRSKIQSRMSLKDEDHFRNAYLLPALKAGLVEMTSPNTPNHPKQRYRLTPKGKALKARLASGRP